MSYLGVCSRIIISLIYINLSKASSILVFTSQLRSLSVYGSTSSGEGKMELEDFE